MEKHRNIPTTFDGELPSVAFSKEPPSNIAIGETYMVDGPDGKEIPAEVTSALIDERAQEMVVVFHAKQVDQAWIARKPISDAELQDYRRFPDTYFGVYRPQGKRADTPLELFDFMYETYKTSTKEKLLEFLKDAPDFEQLKDLPQRELSEIYCERMAYTMMA